MQGSNERMTTNTFTPDLTPNTVGSADGEVLTAPEDWTLLPPGAPALTQGESCW